MSQSIKVLLVDNSDDDRKTVEEHLKTDMRYEYNIESCTNKSQAELHLEQESFDLAIIDLHLAKDFDDSDMSGFELSVTAVKEHKVPVLLITTGAHISLVYKREKELSVSDRVQLNFWDKNDEENFLNRVHFTLKPNNVFIVHGHNHHALSKVENAVRLMGLRPVILKETGSIGESILKELEHYSDRGIAFVIVIATADDVGGKKPPEGEPPVLQPRARQNVIFELGYFLAKFGNRRVRMLADRNLEIPSDYHGYLYISYREDNTNWLYELYKAMKASGLDIDNPLDAY